MKKFFTRIPLQPKGKLGQYQYNAIGNEKLQMDTKTSFPIITAINGYVKENEEIEMYVIVAGTEQEKNNYELFCEEFEEICKKKNIICKKGVVAITIGDAQNVAEHLNTFQKLIDVVEDNDELYACITFGTKPQTRVMMMALQYAYRIQKNASIACIIYGEIIRNEAESSTWYGNVYDMTALIQMDETVRLLADQRVKNPKELIKQILTV